MGPMVDSTCRHGRPCLLGSQLFMKIDFDTFKRSYLVVGLSEPDIKKVMDLATVGEVKNGHEIVKLGTREPDIYIILSGICKVVRKGGALLGTCGVGSVIGEVALLDDQPRSASVVAKGPVTYAYIDGRVLRKFMNQNREIGFVMLANLARLLAMRLRDASESIEDLRGQVSDLWLYKGEL